MKFGSTFSSVKLEIRQLSLGFCFVVLLLFYFGFGFFFQFQAGRHLRKNSIDRIDKHAVFIFPTSPNIFSVCSFPLLEFLFHKSHIQINFFLLSLTVFL